MPRRVDLDPGATRLLRLALLLGALPAVVALALGVVVAAAVEDPFADLVRDLKVTTGAPLHAGALSALTVMVWTAGAAVALTAALPARGRGPLASLLAMCGVLTLALAVDDQFLVHDGLLPGLGLPGELALLAYAVWGAVTVVRHRDLLRVRPETPVLAVGALCLVGSVTVDLVVEKLGLGGFESVRILVEDGLKLVGAAVWGVGLAAMAAAVHALPSADRDRGTV